MASIERKKRLALEARRRMVSRLDYSPPAKKQRGLIPILISITALLISVISILFSHSKIRQRVDVAISWGERTGNLNFNENIKNAAALLNAANKKSDPNAVDFTPHAYPISIVFINSGELPILIQGVTLGFNDKLTNSQCDVAAFTAFSGKTQSLDLLQAMMSQKYSWDSGLQIVKPGEMAGPFDTTFEVLRESLPVQVIPHIEHVGICVEINYVDGFGIRQMKEFQMPPTTNIGDIIFGQPGAFKLVDRFEWNLTEIP